MEHRVEVGIFLLALGLLTSVGSFGFHLNDEADLAVAAYNIYHGSLTADEVPPEYYRLERGSWSPRVVVVDGHGYTFEPNAGAYLSAPFYLALVAWSSLLPLQLFFVVLVAGAFAGATLLLASRHELSNRRRRQRHAWVWGGSLAFVLANVPFLEAIDPDPWAAPLALQLGSMVVLAAGIAAFHAFVRGLTENARTARLSTALLATAVPVLFWGFGVKNHAMQLGLLCLVLAARFTPGTTLRHHALAALLAGVSLWLHPKLGFVLVAACALAEVPRLAKTWREPAGIARRGAVLATLLALGFAPQLVENTLVFGSPTAASYAVAPPAGSSMAVLEPPPDTGSGPVPPSGGNASDDFDALSAGGALTYLRSTSILGNLDLLPAATSAIWVGPQMLVPGIEVQFGLLTLMPFALLAPVGIALRASRPREVDLFLASYAGLLVFLYGVSAAAAGSGSLFARHFILLVPALALYSGVALDRATRPHRATKHLVMAGALAVVGAVLLAWAASAGGYTAQFHHVRTLGTAGALTTGVLAVLADALLLRGRTVPMPATAAIVLATVIPAALFALQFLLHHPPRQIVSEAGTTSQFLPLLDLAGEAMRARLGA